ncbi:MAG TPA: DnaB-like helicase N-terminal domain-containing protein [Conexibacter sp.]|jgi:hypothetical protein
MAADARLSHAVAEPRSPAFGVNLEAEQCVLGALLLSDRALPAVILEEHLQPADFYRETHRRIYEAMLKLHTLGMVVDTRTLVDYLDQSGELESIGGPLAIEWLAGSVPAMSSVRQYASIVRGNSRARQSTPPATLATPRVRVPRRDSRRGCGRPARRRIARAAARGPSSDDGPGSSEPPRAAATYGYGLTRCPTCGGVLLWMHGVLACGTRSCPRWGRPS